MVVSTPSNSSSAAHFYAPSTGWAEATVEKNPLRAIREAAGWWVAQEARFIQLRRTNYSSMMPVFYCFNIFKLKSALTSISRR